MRNIESIKVIIDTNVWVSFLIGKRLRTIKSLLSKRIVILITTTQLIEEIELTTKKPKLSKYFPRKKVVELIEFMMLISENYHIERQVAICRDPKDNYLLDLAESSNADYLVTGDQDLLTLKTFRNTEIVTPSKFEEIVRNLN